MLFFDNPGKARKRRKRKKTAMTRVRRKRKVHQVGSSKRKTVRVSRKHHKEAAVARRKSRKHSRRSAVKVHRRRRAGSKGRVTFRPRMVWAPNPGRSGIVVTLKNGVKDGAVVLASEVVTQKAINAAQKVVPLHGIAGTAVVGLGVPVVVAIAARKVSAKYAGLVTAAAFAQGLRSILAQTPAAPFLSGTDYDGAYAVGDGMGAYPALVAPAMGAYPGEYTASEYVQ